MGVVELHQNISSRCDYKMEWKLLFCHLNEPKKKKYETYQGCVVRNLISRNFYFFFKFFFIFLLYNSTYRKDVFIWPQIYYCHIIVCVSRCYLYFLSKTQWVFCAITLILFDRSYWNLSKVSELFWWFYPFLVPNQETKKMPKMVLSFAAVDTRW